MLESPKNPLLGQKKFEPGFDSTKLKIPFSIQGKVPSRRELKKLMRGETAKQAIGEIYPGCAIFGFTKGQFSLVDLISAILDQTGPASLFVSTWTAAGADLSEAFDLVQSGKITDIAFLVDLSFQRRKPAFAAKIRELFGETSVRVTKNHAKFCLIMNDKWRLVLNTSMNLNFNPRFEDFYLQDDPALADFLYGIMKEIFKKSKKSSLFDKPSENIKKFGEL